MSIEIKLQGKYMDISVLQPCVTQGESNVDEVTITGPRMYDGRLDLTTLSWYMRGVNEGYDVLVEKGVDVDSTEDEVSFRWQVDPDYLALDGKLELTLVGKNESAREVMKIRSNGLNVPRSPEYGAAPPRNVFEDALSQVEAAMELASAAEEAVTDAKEAAQKAAQSAATSEGNAASSATAAQTSKAAAAASEKAAKTSENTAKSQADLARQYAEQAASIAQGQKGYFVTPEKLRETYPSGVGGDWALVGSTDSIWVWDVESGDWVDSHKSTDLSNYYTKEQTEEKFVPAARKINSKPLNADVSLTAGDVGAVPTSRKVNNKPLDADVSLTAGDVGAVPTSRKVNNKPLDADVSLTAGDVGAVPTSRKINNKPLDADVSLTPGDVGALPAAGDGKDVTVTFAPSNEADFSAPTSGSKLSAIMTLLSKWRNYIARALTPTGAVLAYAGATIPAGFLLCDGRAVSRTTYAALFGVIGTTYGSGDGTTTFNLPDLRGRVPVGVDSDANLGGVAGANECMLSWENLPSSPYLATWQDQYKAVLAAADAPNMYGINNFWAGSEVPISMMQLSVYMQYLIKI